MHTSLNKADVQTASKHSLSNVQVWLLPVLDISYNLSQSVAAPLDWEHMTLTLFTKCCSSISQLEGLDKHSEVD